MNTLKTELFKIEFDKNDLSKIVHVEYIHKPESYQSFLTLEHLVSHVIDLKGSYMLSKKEAVKIITKASQWML